MTQTVEPCACPECFQAGVTELPGVLDPVTKTRLHGYAVKRWHTAKDRFLEVGRQITQPSREPGEEG